LEDSLATLLLFDGRFQTFGAFVVRACFDIFRIALIVARVRYVRVRVRVRSNFEQQVTIILDEATGEALTRGIVVVEGETINLRLGISLWAGNVARASEAIAVESISGSEPRAHVASANVDVVEQSRNAGHNWPK